ncbi:MAG: efflux RND transporter periplasmic adaptor subunit [Balneolaceae bacterium]|nr:efflux RND transporter periplasmic adaptor subunit [Balneolaceae bacterium]
MNTKNILLYAGLLVLGLFLGYLFFGGTRSNQSTDEHIEEAHTDEQGNIVYTCSMHPQVRQNEPGNCPICGMELIPAGDDSDQAADNPYTLTMTEASMKLAEIQTTPVVRDRAVSTFTLPGKVTENQNNVSNITAHFPGRIRNLYVDYEGTFVSKGERLASIYSPELIAAQQELLETVKYKNQNPRLYEASRRKLILWEFPESTINEIEESGEIMNELDFYSPVSGYVTQLEVSREDHIMEGDVMYRIVDLSSVWVDFQAFESNISAIEEGDQVRFTVEALPGESFESTVIYVDPFLDDNSRTATIRARVDNPNNRLKPGMLATAEVQSGLSSEPHLLVPRSAVMWTGKRSIVYVQVI